MRGGTPEDVTQDTTEIRDPKGSETLNTLINSLIPPVT